MAAESLSEAAEVKEIRKRVVAAAAEKTNSLNLRENE